MTDELLDYALDQLSPDDRATLHARLATDPVLVGRLTRLQLTLAPLAADREPDEPPVGLAVAGIGRTAEFLVEQGLIAAGRFTADGPASPVGREPRWAAFTRVHANVAVAASILMVVAALTVVGVQKARRGYQTLACQNNMRELHGALTEYSELHGGRFPQTGSATVPIAGAFASELSRTGQPVPPSALLCPTTPTGGGVGYTYSLGFVDPLGRLSGLRKPDSADDTTPILADLPAGGRATAAHGGWNVLTVGGAVRFTTTPAVGPEQDDIFSNTAGLRRAGLHRLDVCLGSPFDRP